MKKITLSLMLFSVIALAQQPTSFSEVSVTNTVNQNTPAPVTVVQGLINGKQPVVASFTDRASFQAGYAIDCGGTLTLEDFGGLPGGVTTCGPIVSSSGDGCYAAGDLVDGFRVTSTNNLDVVGISAGTIGNTIDLVGANDFAEETLITFTVPVAAVGMDIWFNNDPDTRIDVYDPASTLIETFTITGTVGSESFFGFYADELVGSVQVAQLNGGGELIGNMEFANCDNLNVADNLLSQISIFPNPAQNTINVKTPTGVQIQSAVLYDVLGKQVSSTITNGQMDVSALNRGVYLLNIETSAGTLTEKIVKQ